MPLYLCLNSCTVFIVELMKKIIVCFFPKFFCTPSCPWAFSIFRRGFFQFFKHTNQCLVTIWPLKLFTWIMQSITQIAEYAIFLWGTIVPSGWLRPFCSFFRWDFFFSWPPLPLPLSTIELTLFIATFVPSPSFNLFCFSDSQFLLSFAFSSTIYQTYRW